MARNPAWTREEIILATELYIRAEGRILGPDHRDVIKLSDLLNRLPLHDKRDRNQKFRNPQGVAMKLANIRGADPHHEGGLLNGSKLDGLFWEEMNGNRAELFRRAAEIRSRLS